MTETGIYAALAAVMADVDHVAKRDRNTQQNFSFRGVDAVVNAVGPALRKHKVIVCPQVTSADYVPVTLSGGKTATSCRLVATYTFFAEDGSRLSATVAAEAFDMGDKAAPKAMSVAFRTALLQALALPTDEPDPDSQTYEQERPAQAWPVVTDVNWYSDWQARVGAAADEDALRALYTEMTQAHAERRLSDTDRVEAGALVKDMKAQLEAVPA